MDSTVVWPFQQNHLAKIPAQKISDLGKVSWRGEGGSLAFEVQIPVEMDLICTYDASLQQDGIMPEILTQM